MIFRLEGSQVGRAKLGLSSCFHAHGGCALFQGCEDIVRVISMDQLSL